MKKPLLFSPIRLRELEIKNRIFVSPMCQYSSPDGSPQPWHLVHLGSRAVGGAGLIMVEATGVSPEGRISPQDLGLWNDQQMEAFRPITRFLLEHGCVPAIQLAHAGRKASTQIPWFAGPRALTQAQGGWPVVAPSPLALAPEYPTPHALNSEEIATLVENFKSAAQRALSAGFQVIEVHMAHGYLLHEFLSPLTNLRNDQFGGSLENRFRLPLEVTQAVRSVWPEKWPVLVRISATDWIEGGWDLAQSIAFTKQLKQLGVDLVDCSSGGLTLDAKIPLAPGYQVPFAAQIRKQCEIATGAVGLITDPKQAEDILNANEADAIFIGREVLRNPYWPLHAAQTLGADIQWPGQYERAKPVK